jgi:nucleotide-binding universal stress UspA family protein
MESRLPIAEILFYLPTYPDRPSPRQIMWTAALARQLDAKVTAIVAQLNPDPATWPPVMGAYPVDVRGLMAESVKHSEEHARTLTNEAIRLFADAAVQIDIRKRQATLYEPVQPLVDIARLHDLTVLPVPQTDSFDRAYVEPVIFGSGRPVLLLPPGDESAPPKPVKSVLVAWDFGREAGRALSDALPLLAKAEQVTILSVEGAKEIRSAGSPAELKDYLAAHHLDCRFVQTRLGDTSIGECLAAAARDAKADLLVMGAYGHTRLREFLLGGATRYMIAEPPLPILLSH